MTETEQPARRVTPARSFYLNWEIIEWLDSLKVSRSAAVKVVISLFMEQTEDRDPIELGEELHRLFKEL